MNERKKNKDKYRFYRKCIVEVEIIKRSKILRVKDDKDNLTCYERIGKMEHKEIDWEQKLDKIECDSILQSIKGERYL